MINKLLEQFIHEVVKEALSLSTGGGSLQPSGQVSGTAGLPLGMSMKSVHKKLWSGDKPKKKPKRLSETASEKENINDPIEYPAFGGDPNMIQGMMGTDSNFNHPPAHLNPELVNNLSGDNNKRRGRTVSDNLLDEEEPTTVRQTSAKQTTKVYFEDNVLDKQGHKKAPSTRPPYGQTYLQKDDPHRSREMGILKKVKKNLDKKAYTLHDPPSMGISITRPELKDRPNK